VKSHQLSALGTVFKLGNRATAAVISLNRRESTILQLLNHLPFEALTIPLYYPYSHILTPDISIAKSDNLYQDETVAILIRDQCSLISEMDS